MKIKDIYTKYLLPKNLQEHMLRVAALATIITDKWKGEEIPEDDIVNVCLFHDIAKPLTFVPEKQVVYGATQEEIENVKNFQKIIGERYGYDEHTATIAICKEEGLSKNAINIMNKFEWSRMQEMFDENNPQVQIVLYCDMRIGPRGILPLEQRIDDIGKRYNKPQDLEKFKRFSVILDKMMNEKVSGNLQIIDDNNLNNIFPILLERKV